MRAPRDPSSVDAGANAGPVRDLFAAARGELREVPGFGPERERELIGRILARTTRAPARASGRRGPWTSLAAAALLASAGAALLFFRPAHGPATELAVVPAQSGQAPVAPEARAELGFRDALALAREELVSSAAAARKSNAGADAGADARLELRLLEARAKGLRERRWDPWLREVSLSDLGTLSLALWCEVQLDRYVLDGSRPPGWKRAVDILRRDLARQETPPQSSKLLAHALARARDYGLTGDVEVARLDPARPPWSGEWFDDLDAAGREAGIAQSGTWRAWVDWRGQ